MPTGAGLFAGEFTGSRSCGATPDVGAGCWESGCGCGGTTSPFVTETDMTASNGLCAEAAVWGGVGVPSKGDESSVAVETPEEEGADPERMAGNDAPGFPVTSGDGTEPADRNGSAISPKVGDEDETLSRADGHTLPTSDD